MVHSNHWSKVYLCVVSIYYKFFNLGKDINPYVLLNCPEVCFGEKYKITYKRIKRSFKMNAIN